MITRRQAQDLLRQIGHQPDAEIDLAHAALCLAALDQPRSDLTPYLEHLNLLAATVTERMAGQPDTLETRVSTLVGVLVGEFGYHGDTETYDDMRNANLMQVIERRCGLPVALGILFLNTAQAQGWDIIGLNFPGHFLVRLDCASARTILDPFNRGQERTAADLRELLKASAGPDAELTPDHYAPVDNRDILLRLQNNLKLRHLRAERVDLALEVLEVMLLFAPDEPSLWREKGLLQAHQGDYPAAISALETFMDLSTSDRAAHQAAMLIEQLRNQLS